jgi:hypothetical protein
MQRACAPRAEGGRVSEYHVVDQAPIALRLIARVQMDV